MTYKITIEDGPLKVYLETDTADEAAAILAFDVFLKVLKSKTVHLPVQSPWRGPDWGGGRVAAERIWADSFTHNPLTSTPKHSL